MVAWLSLGLADKIEQMPDRGRPAPSFLTLGSSKAACSLSLLVVTWLDLCNAYGSVKHNLVQFALHWYHVPPSLCQLVLNYHYDKICACIQTKEWSSSTFLFDLGLFQGCVLSCILFSCVQLVLDMLEPLSEDNGYPFK